MTNIKQNQRYIVVNATALDQSGAVTILKQFLEAIPENCNDYYIVFVHPGFENYLIKSNLCIVNKKVKSFIRRFFWDVIGLSLWLRKNGISPSVTISLQNTNFRSKSVTNFVYYHQSIPFFKGEWSPFKKDEKVLWFYSKIYPVFVKLLLNKRTEIFVQTRAVKESFSAFYNFPEDKIHIIFPELKINQSLEGTRISLLNKERINLFYPATPFIYKNHKIIFESLEKLTDTLQERITLHLTCTKSEIARFVEVRPYSFEVNYTGNIIFKEVISLYKNADALLFPSYIETLGLPLLEAACFGMPIIVSDLPYSREVLNSYPGAVFVQYDDSDQWMNEIIKIIDNKGRRYDPFILNNTDSWQKLFKIIKNKN